MKFTNIINNIKWRELRDWFFPFKVVYFWINNIQKVATESEPKVRWINDCNKQNTSNKDDLTIMTKYFNEEGMKN